MEQALAALALLAGAFSRGDHRQAALCYLYGITFAIALILMPSPAVFKGIGYSYWYLAWAAFEAVIILECKALVGAPAAIPVKYLSMAAMLMHLVTGFLYVKQPTMLLFYHWHKPVCDAIEVAQICALFLLTPLVRFTVRRVFPQTKGRRFPWLRMTKA